MTNVIPDWTRLAPNRPLDPGDLSYVEPPGGAGQRIANLVSAGRSPVLLAGPVGIGKSTELARAARLLQDALISCLVPLDRFENMRRILRDRALLRVAGRLVFVAGRDSHISVSGGLRNALIRQGVLSSESGKPASESVLAEQPAEDLAVSAIREVARLGDGRRVVLLVDGLEKADEGPAREVLDALADLATEAGLVAVIPWHAAYGPKADTVIAPGEKVIVLRPLDTTAPQASGSQFLREVVARRLGLQASLTGDGVPSEFLAVVDECARWSGGIPRSFLQLLADAAAYARLRGAAWPAAADLLQALAEQRDSYRRLLTPGDDAALKKVDGTDGRELDLERKLRLLSHGMLLEREEKGAPVMRPHPIVKDLLTGFFLA